MSPLSTQFHQLLYLNLQDTMKRSCVGILKCKSCRKVVAGGAWAPSYSAVRNRRGVVITGGAGKSLKLNSRGVVIVGGVEKLT